MTIDEKSASLATDIFVKVAAGQAPQVLCDVYEKMGPEMFGVWIHGFVTGRGFLEGVIGAELSIFMQNCHVIEKATGCPMN